MLIRKFKGSINRVWPELCTGSALVIVHERDCTAITVPPPTFPPVHFHNTYQRVSKAQTYLTISSLVGYLMTLEYQDGNKKIKLSLCLTN
jgi:hypothetical protein